MSRESRRGCFKFGCFGCLGLGAILIAVAVILALIALTGQTEPKVERLERSRDVPAASRIEIPLPLPGADETEPLPAIVPDVAEPGKIVLDVGMGQFEIRAGKPGESLRLEGSYDTAAYELEEKYETYGETGWTYRVSFGGRRFGSMFGGDAGDNRIRLIIPPDLPVTLSGDIGIGESDLELGGLWLLDLDIDYSTGDHQVSFDDPLLAPMERIRLDASIGELKIFRVGNASPATVDVEHNLGEVTVDLRGDWQRDAEVGVRCGVGECTVRVPRDVHLDMADASVTVGDAKAPSLGNRDPVPADAPTLRVSVSAGIGEVSIVDR